MEKKKILVVDDEQDLCDILLYNLTKFGYEPTAVHSAEEALAFRVADFDLLLLDVMMPSMSGYNLANRLKTDFETAHIPIIFLTAKNTENDMLMGFHLGADDYVKKPFSLSELMARVKAVLNRSDTTSQGEQNMLRHEGLTVNLKRKSVAIDGEEIALTKTEFELLTLLLQHKGQVFSRPQLMEKVWPKGIIVTNRAIDVNITRLRKKIGRYSANIVSRQGFGYLFEP